MQLDTIHCGDCVEWLEGLPDGCVEMCLTDIPYNVVNRDGGKMRCLDKGPADSAPCDLGILLPHLLRVTTGSIYIFCGTEQVSEIRRTFVDAGLSTRLCILEKRNPSPMNGQYLWLSSVETCVYGKKPRATFRRICVSPVWRHKVVTGIDHPTPKPVELFAELVDVSSVPNSVVIDPYMGSGTTAVACIRMGRHFLGCEIEPKYVEIANKRIKQARNDTAMFADCQ